MLGRPRAYAHSDELIATPVQLQLIRKVEDRHAGILPYACSRINICAYRASVGIQKKNAVALGESYQVEEAMYHVELQKIDRISHFILFLFFFFFLSKHMYVCFTPPYGVTPLAKKKKNLLQQHVYIYAHLCFFFFFFSSPLLRKQP